MPSRLHEVLADMFRERPEFAAELLGGQPGVTLPQYQQARASPADFSHVTPTEYRADAVITLTVDDAPVASVVVEIQLRADPRKRLTWPVYVATLHARLKCPVFLLVVCPTLSVAAWSATPIVVSNPGLVLTPVVLGPAQVPLVDDPDRARIRPQAAVLSAMAHGDGPDQKAVFDALLAALDTVDHDHAKLYADVVLAELPQAARDYLEELMALKPPYEYQSNFARRYVAEGEAKGEAKAVVAILCARGIDVPDKVRQDILASTDLDQLDLWVRRAVTATTVTDLFDEHFPVDDKDRYPVTA